MFVSTDEYRRRSLANSFNAAVATAVHAMLIKAPFEPSADLTVGAVSEADFGGYARQALSKQARFRNLFGVWVFNLGDAFFTGDGTTAPQLVYGWGWVIGAGPGGGTLLATATYSVPKVVAANPTVIIASMVFPWGQ